MNGSKSPNAAADAGDVPPATNGVTGTKKSNQAKSAKSDEQKQSNKAASSQGTEKNAENNTGNGADDDGASEAETLITSPVKKREAAKHGAAVKTEKPLKSRIGGLPVPGEDDEDSVASPMPSTEVSPEKAATGDNTVHEDVDMAEEGGEAENASDLSSARSSLSRASSRSRAVSELPNLAHRGDSPNPRKRKFRASSVGVPSHKRQTMEPPRNARKMRGMQSEDVRQSAERSTSPKLRSHRRTISTQSVLDGVAEGAGRKRRGGAQASARDAKSVKTESADSDASSETTSRGGDDKRTLRQTGRSTSTPGGRNAQREHKRHVNKYGFTRLAEACENDDLDAVKQWRVKDPDQLELAEFAGNKPLQIAALNGNSDVVAYLIKEGCDIDCANADKDTPLIDAAENGHLEVVKLLLNAGVDPLRQNLKGQQALDVVTDEEDDAKEIRIALRDAIDRWNSDDAKQRREEEEIQRHRGGPSKELHFMARTYENLLKLVTINDRNGVQEFLDARVPVDNTIIAAAAKTGDSYLMSMLLAEMTEKKAFQKPEKPMLAVLGTSHFEMVKLLTELDQFNPLWESRQNKTWPEVAEERNGPMWRQERELLQRLYDQHVGSKARRSSSPVSKRDANGKRRVIHPQSDDSEDDDDDQSTTVAKRKNGRRLMSRKDMRAATGKGQSDSSGEDDESSDNSPERAGQESATNDQKDGAMKPPPDTPTTRRSAGRTRSKSISSQPSELSPRTRRRSITLRGDQALPTVEEKSSGETAPVEKRGKSETKASKAEKDKEETKRKQAAETAEKAKTKKAEDDRVAAEKRKADEQLRLEQEQQAEETRKQEEAQAAEEARKAEEERIQREKEAEEAMQKLRVDVLASLPPVLRELLDPASDFSLDGADGIAEKRAFLLRHFTPLHVLSADGGSESTGLGGADCILNLEIAPLLGKQGLQLFFDETAGTAKEDTLHSISRQPLLSDDQRILEQVLATFPLNAAITDDEDNDELENGAEDSEKAREHRRRARLLRATTDRLNTYFSARRRLTEKTCPAALRRVPVTEALRHLNAPFVGGKLDSIDLLPSESNATSAVLDTTAAADDQDFVSALQRSFARRCGPRTIAVPSTGELQDLVPRGAAGMQCQGVTNVVVVHEK